MVRSRIVPASLAMVALVWLLGAATAAAQADEHRFFLASQHRWDLGRGFLLELHGAAQSGPVTVGQVRLVAMVGDGHQFKTMETSPFELDRRYVVKLVIASTGSRLYLDEKLVGQTTTGFAPLDGVVSLSELPSWAAAPADFDIMQGPATFSESGEGGRTQHVAVGDDSTADPAMLIFNEADTKYEPWTCDPQRTLTIQTSFRIVAKPDLKRLVPLVDRYGQFAHATWPGKIQSDDQLRQSFQEELKQLDAWGVCGDFDAYGGYLKAGWHEPAKGFYGVVKRGGYWWLVTPEGNPCFYTGVDTLPALTWDMTPVTGRESVFAELPKDPIFAAAWATDPWGGHGDNTACLAFHTVNMIRKFGAADWKEHAINLTARRLKGWAFSGAGKWGGIFGDGARMGELEGVGCVGYLRLPGVRYTGGKPDIFDPQVCQQIHDSLAGQIIPHKDNKWVLGWAVGNEYDEIVKPEDIRALLASKGPGKHALVDFAVQSYGDGGLARLTAAWHTDARSVAQLYEKTLTPAPADLEQMRRFFADRYYAAIYQTCKQIDPNHLYFGYWIVPGWWVNDEDWRLITRHCDVVGYDIYDHDFANGSTRQMMKEMDKPTLVGEFGFTPVHGGKHGYATYKTVGVEDEAQAGAMYDHFVGGAARDPYCIGTMWFQYRDEAVTGRGPGSGFAAAIGEHYAFGLVDITDTPKWDLVRAVRQTNLHVSAWRLQASQAQASRSQPAPPAPLAP